MVTGLTEGDMANTTCAKCGNGSFELKETKITRATYRHQFVQCSSCGTAVGVLDFDSPTTAFSEIIQKIDQLAAEIRQLKSR
jgi:uncharacterized Zn finger protein